VEYLVAGLGAWVAKAFPETVVCKADGMVRGFQTDEKWQSIQQCEQALPVRVKGGLT
jgi:hypothetical protein